VVYSHRPSGRPVLHRQGTEKTPARAIHTQRQVGRRQRDAGAEGVGISVNPGELCSQCFFDKMRVFGGLPKNNGLHGAIHRGVVFVLGACESAHLMATSGCGGRREQFTSSSCSPAPTAAGLGAPRLFRLPAAMGKGQGKGEGKGEGKGAQHDPIGEKRSRAKYDSGPQGSRNYDLAGALRLPLLAAAAVLLLLLGADAPRGARRAGVQGGDREGARVGHVVRAANRAQDAAAADAARRLPRAARHRDPLRCALLLLVVLLLVLLLLLVVVIVVLLLLAVGLLLVKVVALRWCWCWSCWSCWWRWRWN